MLRDLEGVRYVEIPWLADPGAPQFAGVPRPNYGDPVLERLYALGLDAFAVAQLIAQPVPPERIELDGATGHLSLTPAHSFQRDGRVMVIRAILARRRTGLRVFRESAQRDGLAQELSDDSVWHPLRFDLSRSPLPAGSIRSSLAMRVAGAVTGEELHEARVISFDVGG